jgi:hypothetical protein
LSLICNIFFLVDLGKHRHHRFRRCCRHSRHPIKPNVLNNIAHDFLESPARKSLRLSTDDALLSSSHDSYVVCYTQQDRRHRNKAARRNHVCL